MSGSPTHLKLVWKKGLSGDALRIASSDSRILRVLAGPGTGKTFALMRRIARLLEEGQDPSRILMVTFTRTAAADLCNQLGKLGIAQADRVIACTLHSLCYKILARKEVGSITKRVPRTLFRYEADYLLRDLGPGFGTIIQRRRLLEAFIAGWCRMQTDQPGPPRSSTDADFESKLHEWLEFHNAMLVGELVPLALRYLSSNPTSPDASRFDHILVDEYQDLNRADQTVIDLLGSKSALTVAGDENQSIYGFRYAHPQGILDFPKNHPGTTTETLTECRRCPDGVICLANNLIDAAGGRNTRHLKACKGSSNGDVHLLTWRTPEEETAGLSSIVKSFLDLDSPHSAGDVLALVPRKVVGSKFAESLSQLQIPVELAFGDDDIFETNTAQTRLSLLRLLVDPYDKAALRCWLGVGSNSSRSAAYAKLREVCRTAELTPREILDDMVSGKRDIDGTDSLVTRYLDLQDQLVALTNLAGQSFLDAWLPVGDQACEPLRRLIEDTVVPETTKEEILDFITNYLARPEAPIHSSSIRIMTLHKAKGLQADTVLVLGLVDGLVPSMSDPASQGQLEEQRRLLYVALTRARHRLILSTWKSASQAQVLKLKAAPVRWAGKGIQEVRRSRFLKDLGLDSSQISVGTKYEAGLRLQRSGERHLVENP